MSATEDAQRKDLLGKFACRFCRHDQYEHNLIEGCPVARCRCMATPGEASAVTDQEMAFKILPADQVLAHYQRVPESEPEPNPDALHRYDEAAAQMADPDRYADLRALTFAERHACPVADCRLSAEEHHRLAFGYLSENRELKRRIVALEHGRTESEDG